MGYRRVGFSSSDILQQYGICHCHSSLFSSSLQGPPAPIDMVSTSLGSQRLIGGGLRDFPFITMGFSACANKMPIRIFIF